MAVLDQIRKYVTGVLKGWFPNKKTLDKFSDNNGIIMYDGNILNPIGYTRGRNDTPVGTIIAFMGNNPPEHYLACNGQELNIADYLELAQFFKTEFGSINHFGGDGTTIFTVPDLKGEFLRGTGTNSYSSTATLCGNGANVGQHQNPTRLVPISTNNNGVYAPIGFMGSNYDNMAATSSAKAASFSSATGTIAKQVSTRPTNTSVLWCIKYETVYPELKDEYSLNEIQIGTWIDGKPLYRRVFQSTTPDTINQDKYITTDLTCNQIDTLVKLEGLIKDNSTLVQWEITQTNTHNLFINQSGILCTFQQHWLNYPITIIAEYTKPD